MENGMLFHATGLLCVLIFVVGLQFKCNDKLKKYMTVGSLIAATNMFLMGQYSGMVINIINFFRNILSLNMSFIEKYKHIVSFIFVSSYVAIQYFIQDQYWYLPVLASTVGLVAVFYLKGIYVRYSLLLGTLTWLSYALLHGNIYGVILESLVVCSFISSFIVNKMEYEDKNINKIMSKQSQ